MFRVIAFLIIVAAAALLYVFALDHYGAVSVSLGQWEIKTPLAFAVAALLAFAVVLYVLVRLFALLLRLPFATFALSRSRRKAKANAAISKGLVAVASGDLNAAARHAQAAERLAGHEPLALLLKAQAAQLHGNRVAAKDAFARMAEITDTRGLGLRGLFVEARRRGDGAAAHQHAVAAAQLDVFLPWAHEATLVAQCQARDWMAALATLERNHRLGAMDAGEMRRAKAALLTARALDLRRTEPKEALRAALNALKIDQALTPAATAAARLLAADGQQRKASRIVETAWRLAPHPDLAEAYLGLRPNLSAAERLKQVSRLVAMKPEHEEAAAALAQAALAAREFAKARAALAPLADKRPTARICLLMAEIEEAENGMTGLAREWLGRAAHASRDPAWIADGIISPQWLPVAPESGRIGGFAWEHPAELPAAVGSANLPAPIAAPRPPSPSDGLADRAAELSIPAGRAGNGPQRPADAPAETPLLAAPIAASFAADRPAPAAERGVAAAVAAAPAKIETVAFPLERAPDDPGAGPPPREKGFWKRLTE
ncbi:HemY protein [Rhizobiales bacterium GAS188]|nr:HemY protein [Rhizobiales bacterium GAS188]